MATPGLTIAHELRREPALLRALAGQLDERIEASIVDPAGAALMALDLQRIVHVTSFGVRDWIRHLKLARGGLQGLYFLRASPRVTDQFNMVVGFDAGGVLLSFRTYYVCSSCGESSECSFDTQLDRAHFEALTAPVRQCQSCGRDAELDDDPAVLFEYARASRATPPPPEIMALFRHEDAPAQELPGVRLATRPAATEDGTLFELHGIVDETIPARRIADAASGTIDLDVQNVTHLEAGAIDKWNGLLEELAQKGKLRLSGCPPVLLRRIADDACWRGNAEVTSVALPMRCDGCRRTSWLRLPVAGEPWSSAKAACKACQRPLKPLVPVTDLAAFHSAALSRAPAAPRRPTGTPRPAPAPARPQTGPQSPPPAENFDQKYEQLCKIGQGGMADVFLVRQRGAMGFKRLVVIKKVRKEFLTDDRLVRLFLDEARLAARIEHPNVIRIHDLGRAGDTYFMVMDFVHGRSVLEALRELRARRERVPVSIAATIAADLCAGLSAAHMSDSTGTVLVHRDVTPNNVLVSFDGGVKLVDFGLAGYHHFAKDELRARHILGNVPFIAPEIYLGKKAVPQTDLWGVGLTLFTMLTTENPFQRDTVEKTAVAVVNDSVSRPWRRVPRKLFAIIDKSIKKDPTARYQSAIDMERDLRAVIPKLGGPTDVSAWMRGLFSGQIRIENEFARRYKSPTLTDGLLNASPQDAARLYRVLYANSSGAPVPAAESGEGDSGPGSDSGDDFSDTTES